MTNGALAVLILTDTIDTLPGRFIKGRWSDDKGGECGGEYVHTQIVKFGACTCKSDEDDEYLLDCIARALGVDNERVYRLADEINDGTPASRRAGAVKAELDIWLREARARTDAPTMSFFDIQSAADKVASAADEVDVDTKSPAKIPAGVT